MKYFLSYFGCNSLSQWTMGNAIIKFNKKIETMEDINEIENEILKKSDCFIKKVIVINYKEMGDDK